MDKSVNLVPKRFCPNSVIDNKAMAESCFEVSKELYKVTLLTTLVLITRFYFILSVIFHVLVTEKL